MTKSTGTKMRLKDSLEKCEIFTSFINEKHLHLEDREYLLFKQFIRNKKTIEQTKNIIEILLGYIFTEKKPKTLIVCDHIMCRIIHHKTKKYLNHNCSIDSCFDAVSNYGLKMNMNQYHKIMWDRIIVFGTSEYLPLGKEVVAVTNVEKNENRVRQH